MQWKFDFWDLIKKWRNKGQNLMLLFWIEQKEAIVEK